MKYFLIIIGVIILLGIFLGVKAYQEKQLPSSESQTIQTPPQSDSEVSQDIPQITVIATNLDTPWGIVFLPDKSMLVTERPGRIRLIDDQGNLQSEPVATLNNAQEIGEGGLLGITLHPAFANNNYIYLYYTYSENGNNTLNRVVRMTYQNKHLIDEQVIVDKIPGAYNHNGGRIKFGPDGYLYITTGDAENPSQSQSTSTLGGKILRVTDKGKAAPGNPFGNLIYSYGHRNPQGITWDSDGQLWEVEHGPSGGSFGTGNDEVNKILAGKNYGWPTIQGDQTRSGMETPVLNSTPQATWAPSGLDFYNGSLYFAGLRGAALYEYKISENKLNEYLKNKYGRLREVVLGPDNLLYITTSNKDSRGKPGDSDDRILKINPQKL